MRRPIGEPDRWRREPLPSRLPPVPGVEKDGTATECRALRSPRNLEGTACDSACRSLASLSLSGRPCSPFSRLGCKGAPWVVRVCCFRCSLFVCKLACGWRFAWLPCGRRSLRCSRWSCWSCRGCSESGCVTCFCGLLKHCFVCGDCFKVDDLLHFSGELALLSKVNKVRTKTSSSVPVFNLQLAEALARLAEAIPMSSRAPLNSLRRLAKTRSKPVWMQEAFNAIQLPPVAKHFIRDSQNTDTSCQ